MSTQLALQERLMKPDSPISPRDFTAINVTSTNVLREVAAINVTSINEVKDVTATNVTIPVTYPYRTPKQMLIEHEITHLNLVPNSNGLIHIRYLS